MATVTSVTWNNDARPAADTRVAAMGGPTTSESYVSPSALPWPVEPYRANRVTGSFVVIDEHTNTTVAGGVVGSPNFAALPRV